MAVGIHCPEAGEGAGEGVVAALEARTASGRTSLYSRVIFFGSRWVREAQGDACWQVPLEVVGKVEGLGERDVGKEKTGLRPGPDEGVLTASRPWCSLPRGLSLFLPTPPTMKLHRGGAGATLAAG
ncbi:hypothetical protein Slala05_84340 [Streptomyces lavendulae subsp. lavendulae]|nr:hypothetical protein Slala05_84340 [Streptomyces lavendulae subsp. lavendulae]